MGSAMATYLNGELADKSSCITHSLPQTGAECSGVRQEVRGPLAQIRLQITSDRVHEWMTYDPYSRDAPGGSEVRACACVSATATAAADPWDLYECKRRTALRNKSRKRLNDRIYSRNLLAPAMRYKRMHVLYIDIRAFVYRYFRYNLFSLNTMSFSHRVKGQLGIIIRMVILCIIFTYYQVQYFLIS